MITVSIRRAYPQDAPQIALIKQRVWPDEVTSQALVSRILQQARHVTHVAVGEDHRTVGFVDCFATTGSDSVTRWEVDLLAVDPDYHRQKIGQRLIAAATEAGWASGTALARALVHIENFACQGAMQRCGYASDGQVYHLMISQGHHEQAGGSLDGAQVIAVETMNYAGLWLEGALTAVTLEAAQTEQARRGGPLVGTLIPAEESAALEAAVRLGYRLAERFHWWVNRR